MANTINATINGVVIPVEVSDEEYFKIYNTGYREGYAKGENNKGYGEGEVNVFRWVIEKMVDNILTSGDINIDRDTLLTSEEYSEWLNDWTEVFDTECFAEDLVEGRIKERVTEWLKEHKSKMKYYEFELDLFRRKKERATVTVCIKAESYEKAEEWISDNMHDVEEKLYSEMDIDWEYADDDYDDDLEVDDWHENWNEYTSVKDACNVLNED